MQLFLEQVGQQFDQAWPGWVLICVHKERLVGQVAAQNFPAWLESTKQFSKVLQPRSHEELEKYPSIMGWRRENRAV